MKKFFTTILKYLMLISLAFIEAESQLENNSWTADSTADNKRSTILPHEETTLGESP